MSRLDLAFGVLRSDLSERIGPQALARVEQQLLEVRLGALFAAQSKIRLEAAVLLRIQDIVSDLGGHRASRYCQHKVGAASLRVDG